MRGNTERIRLLKRMIRYAAAGDKTAYDRADEQYRTKFMFSNRGRDSSDQCDLCRQSCTFSMTKPDMKDAYVKDAKERLARVERAERGR